MRILRSRSDQEVSSTGFALFIAGLILAGFIGGAIRTVLSSEQIQNRILTELQTALPALQVKMDPARISLARGIWPGLSIAIPKLHLVKPEACGETYGTLELENISLPLDVFTLLKSRVRWDVVSVEKLALVYNRKICPGLTPTSSPETKNDVAALNALTDSADRVRTGVAQAFSTAQDLEKYIRGVRIKQVEITAAEDPTWKIGISDLNFHTGHHLTAYAKLHYEKAIGLGHIEHEATLNASADADEFKWDLKSPLKEGLLTWTGTANQTRDQLNQKVTIRQVPLKDVLSEMQTWAGAAKGGSPRFIWLSCDLEQTGALSQFKKIPMQISECKIDGEGEQIRAVPGQQVWPWERTPLHQPLRFQVTKLSLQTLFDLSAKEGLPAIFPKLGQWTGDLQFSNPRDWQMDGWLEGTDVIFSNQSVRGKQTIVKMKTVVQSEAGRVNADLSNIVLADGLAEGKVQFRFDDDFKTGDVDVDLSAFSLSPAVQTLMSGGLSTPMKISGHGRLEHGQWRNWRGSAQWKTSEGRGWKIDQPNIDTGYRDGLFTVTAHADAAQMGSEFAFFDSLKPLIGDWVPVGAVWNFTQGSGTAVISKEGGEIKNLSFHGLKNRAYRFRGTWARGGELSGEVDVSAKSTKKWKVRGWDTKVVLDELQ